MPSTRSIPRCSPLADRAGGVAAMVILSLAGTLAAAALAAGLARRVDPALARPTVWVVGLASPLLFDGYLVMAHALAAAAAVGAVLLAVRAMEERSPALALAVAPCVAAAVMLRTEAVFLAAGLAVVAVLVSRQRDGFLVAAASGVGALAALVGEDWWSRQILGPPVPGTAGGSFAGTGLAGRMHGFVLTWLTPGYDGGGLVDVALIVMLAVVALAALTIRRRPTETRAVVGLSVIAAAAAAVVALVAGPANIVPGLLVAFPLAAAGLLLVDRATLATTAAKVAAGTFALFALAVLATQYSRGGSGEWGGRYFALGIPVVVPVLLAAVFAAGGRLAPQARRVAAGSLLVIVAGPIGYGHRQPAGQPRLQRGHEPGSSPGDGLRRRAAGRPRRERHRRPPRLAHVRRRQVAAGSGRRDRGGRPPGRRGRDDVRARHPHARRASRLRRRQRRAGRSRRTHLVRRRPPEAVGGWPTSSGGRGGCPCGHTPPRWPSSWWPCCP